MNTINISTAMAVYMRDSYATDLANAITAGWTSTVLSF
jgi:FMN phosphatase YigB (HAD superfamily)